jgi:hypothetical protein
MLRMLTSSIPKTCPRPFLRRRIEQGSDPSPRTGAGQWPRADAGGTGRIVCLLSADKLSVGSERARVQPRCAWPGRCRLPRSRPTGTRSAAAAAQSAPCQRDAQAQLLPAAKDAKLATMEAENSASNLARAMECAPINQSRADHASRRREREGVLVELCGNCR